VKAVLERGAIEKNGRGDGERGGDRDGPHRPEGAPGVQRD
jgi:hypothetical protein